MSARVWASCGFWSNLENDTFAAHLSFCHTSLVLLQLILLDY